MKHLVIPAIVLLAVLALPNAVANPPSLLSYQGQLVDDVGTPITAPTVLRFTLLWGGTATELLSTGKPVYQEEIAVNPDANGIFAHQIGAGTPTSGCDEDRDGSPAEPCVLLPDDFPDAATVVFLEVRVDPGGANSPLLPRRQIVSVGYAMNAATVNGIGVDALVTDLDEAYDADGPGSGRAIVADAGPVVISGPDGLEVAGPTNVNGVLGTSAGIRQPIYGGTSYAVTAGPGSTGPLVGDWFTVGTGFIDFAAATIPGGSGAGDTYRDNLLCVGFNSICSGGGRSNTSFHSFARVMEAEYWSDTQGTRYFEYNWNFTSALGVGWRPFSVLIDLGPDGDSDGTALYDWTTGPTPAGLNYDIALRVYPEFASFYLNNLFVPKGKLSINADGDFDLDLPYGFHSSQRQTLTGPSTQLHTAVAAVLEADITTSAHVAAVMSGGWSLGELVGANANTFSTQVTGHLAEVRLTGDGAAAAPSVAGLKALVDVSGSNYDVGPSAGLFISRLVAPGPGTTVARYDGIDIPNRHADGIPGDAIRIGLQTGVDGNNGNIHMVGGRWDEGHLRLRDSHLFAGADGLLRSSIGPPTSGASGKPLFMPPGANPSHGNVFWGDASNPAFDSGDDVCTTLALTCKTTFDFGSSTEVGCSDDSRSTGMFMALCY